MSSYCGMYAYLELNIKIVRLKIENEEQVFV